MTTTALSIPTIPALPAIPALRAIRLPQPAYRLSWLMRAAMGACSIDFPGLLRELAPGVFRRLRDRSVPACYAALLAWLGRQIPTIEDAEFYIENYDPYEDDVVWWWSGVPMAPVGIEPQYLGEMFASPATCVAWLLCASDQQQQSFGVPCLSMAALVPYQPLEAWLPEGAQCVEQSQLLFPFGDQNYEWVKPWNGLLVLRNWAVADTGYDWFDLNVEYMEECDCYPPWNADEIRSLIADWNVIKPIWERIKALVNYVDAKPEPRLKTLSALLRGDPEVTARYSRRSSLLMPSQRATRRAPQRARRVTDQTVVRAMVRI